MAQTQPHGYMQPGQPSQSPMPQGPIRGYTPASQSQMNVTQNQPNYPANQPAPNVSAQNQTHRYPADQQTAPPSNPQNPVHGYGHHIVPTPAVSSSQGSPYPQQNQQAQTAPPSNQAHPAYPSNHPGTGAMPQTPQAHRYGAAQQTQVAQNQPPMTYPPSQQQANPSMGPNDQLYSRQDSAVSQQAQSYTPAANEFSGDRSGASTANSTAGNYTAGQPQTQNPVMPNYPSSDGSSHQNPAVGQMKGTDDPYWQRNYPQTFRSEQQCNDSYYRDQMNPSVNRYQNNYFPPQNYPNQQSYTEYATSHGSDMSQRPDESKGPQQAGAHPPSVAPCDKSNKDMTSSIGVQSQPMHQSNLTGAPGYNTEPNRQTSATPIPRSVQAINSAHSPRLNQTELSKEDEREKEEQLEKDKEEKSDDEILTKDEEKDCKSSPCGKEDPGIPYDWVR